MPDSSDPRAPRDTARDRQALNRERTKLTLRIDQWLHGPMTALAFVWLVLIIVDLTHGLSPFLTVVNYVIWGLFVAHFLVEVVLAPHKLAYIRRNWLTAVALFVPALRVLAIFRIARILSAFRGLSLVRIVAGANRGMRALGNVFGRRGFPYVATLSLVVTAVGAAGIQAFEHSVPNNTVSDYGSALWWTAMMLTTMGSDYFPKTPAGRLLGLLLALYGFAVFGYVTATVASYFVARDADEPQGEVAGAKQLVTLQRQIADLNAKLDRISTAVSRDARGDMPAT